ncbi:MAG TPA: response regulator [Polyangiales bacterium]|nr:response regulator [Polyangiales bacterium]
MSQRILVFENDATFAQEVKSSFERLGASVQVAADGPSGLELAAGNRPDLILLTIELPGMNGFLVCKKIKKTSELENVPLVILSSEVDEETFEQHKKLRTRADEYIRKPIAFADLFERVKPLVHLNGNGAAALVEQVAEHDDAIALAEDDELIVLGDEEAADVDAQADTGLTASPEVAAVESVAPPPRSERPPAPATFAVAQPSFAAASAFVPDRHQQTAPVAAPPVFTPAPAPSPSSSSSNFAAVSGANTLELERLRRELQASDERLQQAEKRLASAEQRATAADKALDAAKRTGGVSSRELLDMREQLNRKERELLDLRDQVTQRDKQLIEASERGLGVERDLQDARDKNVELQRELEKKLEVVNALTADKDASKKRLDDAKARSERAEAKQKELGAELDEIKSRHAGELEKLRADFEMREATRKAEHTALLAKATEEHGAALESARSEHQRALERVEQERDKALASARQEHSAALERAQRESASALESLRRSHAEELSELREEHAVSQKVAADAAEQDKRTAVDGLRAELVSAHEAQTRELVSAHEAERERTSRKHSAELTEQTDKHRQDMARLGRALSEAESRYALLEEKHEETEGLRQTAERNLKAMTGERDQQIARGAELQGEIDRLKAKIARDDETLARVQKALAIGIGLLEERKTQGS